MVEHPEEEVSELAELLVGIQRLIRRRLRQDLTGPPMRGAQVELLRLVRAHPGIGVAAAAKELHLAGNSVSTLVNQLVTAGLLDRQTDSRDRRAVRLTITDQAEERLDGWDSRRGGLVARQVAALSVQDRAALVAALPALQGIAEGLHTEVTEGT